MPELQIERIFSLKNFPSMDIRVVISSTDGAVMGTAQTGGRMQVVMVAPKAAMINAGVYTKFGAPKPKLPRYVAKIIQDVSRGLGSAACFASMFSITCTIENRSFTQEEVLRIFDEISRKLEQEVEQVELVMPRGMYR